MNQCLGLLHSGQIGTNPDTLRREVINAFGGEVLHFDDLQRNVRSEFFIDFLLSLYGVTKSCNDERKMLFTSIGLRQIKHRYKSEPSDEGRIFFRIGFLFL